MFDLLAKMCLICELPYLLFLQSLFKLCSDAISVNLKLNYDFDFDLETAWFPSTNCSKTWG